MPKNSLPVMKTGGGVVSKLVGWAITVLIVVLAIQHPSEAGQVVTSVFAGLHSLIAR